MKYLWQSLLLIPALILIGMVRVYQMFISPMLGANCRFQPTCSRYFIEAVEKYGTMRGSYKGIRRLLRCHPFYKGHWYDPP